MKENNFSTRSDCAQTIVVMCPLCNEDISDLKERINMHLEECFSSSTQLLEHGHCFKRKESDQNDANDQVIIAENYRLEKRVKLDEEATSNGSLVENENKGKCTNCKEINDGDSIISVACWHVFCGKCWFRRVLRRKFCVHSVTWLLKLKI